MKGVVTGGANSPLAIKSPEGGGSAIGEVSFGLKNSIIFGAEGQFIIISINLKKPLPLGGASVGP